VIRSILKYWLPVFLWLAIIFSASADKSSGDHSSRIIGPIVRWFVPNISEENLDAIVHGVRKAAHATEYAVLALLLWHALSNTRARRGDEVPASNDPRQWRWRPAIMAFVLAVLYAASDEFHQTFVPSRTGQVSDVLVDSAGAALGLALAYLVTRYWTGRKQPASG
jgi:VanZ family protein